MTRGGQDIVKTNFVSIYDMSCYLFMPILEVFYWPISNALSFTHVIG